MCFFAFNLNIAIYMYLRYSGERSAMFELVIYKTSTEKEPFNEWLSSLDKSVLGQVMSRIDRLQDGYLGKAKALKDGLFEIKFKSPAFRIYYVMIGRQVVLLLTAGDKTSQFRDIKKARDYLKDYRRRYEKKC